VYIEGLPNISKLVFKSFVSTQACILKYQHSVLLLPLWFSTNALIHLEATFLEDGLTEASTFVPHRSSFRATFISQGSITECVSCVRLLHYTKHEM